MMKKLKREIQVGNDQPLREVNICTMENLKLFDAEYKFMSIVWKYEPVNYYRGI